MTDENHRRAQAMTRRRMRRLAWVGVALCLVLMALGVTERLLAPLPGVTEENLGRVRSGMTVAEVEALFGGAAKVDHVLVLAKPEDPDRRVRPWYGKGVIV